MTIKSIERCLVSIWLMIEWFCLFEEKKKHRLHFGMLISMSMVPEFGVYQMAMISLLNRVSISTRQMGQCLFVTSHWSTQSIWKRCMQGKRLTSFSISNNDKQIVHFSPPSSSSSSLWRRTRLYLCGSVFRSIVSYREQNISWLE